MAGEQLGTSDWVVLDQDKINMFAECTGDKQWIHVDVERAKRESPFGGPVAHGYLTLSLLAGLTGDMDIMPQGAVAVINYGLDKARFLNPVAVGSKVRMHVKLSSFDRLENGHFMMKTENTIEIENVDKPALVAEALMLIVPGPDAKLEA
ncbi:MAG: MaoC family dehydratase [Rhizobiaceae bacterium]